MVQMCDQMQATRMGFVDDVEFLARDGAVTVRSEVDGAVSEVKVAPGQSVAAGQVLMTIKQSYPAKTIDVRIGTQSSVSLELR